MDVAERIRAEGRELERRDVSAPSIRRNRVHAGKRELGHIHGDRLADLPFPRVSKPIRGDDDVQAVLELFRLSYERATAAAARRRW
jgi:hypothetical protein